MLLKQHISSYQRLFRLSRYCRSTFNALRALSLQSNSQILPNKRKCCVSKQSKTLKMTPSNEDFSRLRVRSIPLKSGVFNKEVRALHDILRRSHFSSTTLLKELCSINYNDCKRFFSTSNNHYNKQDNDKQDDKEKDPQDEDKVPFVARAMLLFWLAFLITIIMRLQSNEDSSMYQFVSWNEFVHDMLANGEVEEIIVRPEVELAYIRLYPGAVIKGKKAESDLYTLKILDANKFEQRIRKEEADLGIKPEKGIHISYQRENSWSSLVFMAIIVGALFLVFRNVKFEMPASSDLFGGARKAKFVRADQLTIQGKGVTFREVAGLHEAKTEVMEFVDYLKKPEKYKELGARIPRGALLLGPPGCGKTLLARAVATEARVPFLAMAGSEFIEMIGGLGAARVRDLFKEAKNKAPCIIYIDEIDAIGKKRFAQNRTGGSGEEEQTLNQLLVEMDGMDTVEGIIMLASTNRHDVLDQALLRPGRFDRHIMIDLPTLAERKEIFEIYLGKLRLAKLVNAYTERLAQLSPGMSGADIANICNEAALMAARDQKKAVDTEDFEHAVERIIAGVAKKSRVLSPQEKKVVAYHEAGHALVGWLLQHTDVLLKVSIIPRTSAALGFAQYMPSDKKLISKEEIFQKMCMALGGRVAESIIFNSITSGAQDDLNKVTKWAYDQVRQLGMSDVIGQVSFPVGDENKFAAKPYSRKLSRMMDQESQKLVAQAYKTTETLLLNNKEKLRVIAEALLEKETLLYSDMEELVGPPPYEKENYFSESSA